jgi:hypothetical protein
MEPKNQLPEDFKLAHGAHNAPEQGMCLLEAVSYVAGEPFTDRPQCVDPVLGAFGRALNDNMLNAERQKLLPLIPLMLDTRVDDTVSLRRAMLLCDGVIRQILPNILEQIGLPAVAGNLRGLAEVKDAASASAASAAANAAASAAWSAESAAESAAASAAWSAESAAESAANAARAAASAATSAAWSAARSAESAASAAASAARGAARSAANAANAANATKSAASAANAAESAAKSAASAASAARSAVYDKVIALFKAAIELR